MPDGAFYVYADCSRFTDDADAFAKEVLTQAGVVIVPGLDFGPATANTYVRLSYANSFENLEEAVARLSQFLQSRPAYK